MTETFRDAVSEVTCNILDRLTNGIWVSFMTKWMVDKTKESVEELDKLISKMPPDVMAAIVHAPIDSSVVLFSEKKVVSTDIRPNLDHYFTKFRNNAKYGTRPEQGVMNSFVTTAPKDNDLNE